VEELAEILAVDFGATGGIPKLNEDLRWEDQEQAVLSACSSLISVVRDDGSRVVQFSHFSVKEFLTSDRLAISTIDASHYHHILLEPSHTIMAQACLSVLLRLDSPINKDSLKDFPLARYASQHFGDHAEFGNVFAHIREGIDDLLDADKPHFAAWLLGHQGHFRRVLERPEATPLYHVARFGYRAMVDYLISKRPEDLIVRGSYGIPLHASLHNGHADVALLLLGHCTDVDVRGIDDRTPLHMAADCGLLEVTRILIERGASINARDSSDRTPLHPTFNQPGTFDETYFDVVQYLLEHGIDVDAQANTENSTPLHLASYFGGFRVAQLLLDHGADINVRDKNGQTPLHGTVVDLYDDASDLFFNVIQFLLEHGADVVAQDHDHLTPLHVASRYNGTRVVRLLLEHSANVDARDNEYATPLHFASRCGNVKVARLLLEHGAGIHALDGNLSTPLHFASEISNADTARLLLEHGADVHALDNNHSTPLHFTSRRGHSAVAVARVLLEHGAVVDARDNEDSTPLHVSAQHGNTEVARLLLEHGAVIHVRNKKGQTPQHLLVTMWSNITPNNDVDTVRFFLDRGADVDAVDDNRSTLLQRVSGHGNVEVAQLLLERGANINVRNREGQTPLHRALVEITDEFEDIFFEAIQLLLEHGADVDTLDNDHLTPLHLASQYGSVTATRLLLEHGANVHLQNNDGHTPYQVASANGHEEIARLLSEHFQSERKI
jgi:cytohesin